MEALPNVKPGAGANGALAPELNQRIFGLLGSRSVEETPVRMGAPVEFALVSGLKIVLPSGFPCVMIWIRPPLRYCCAAETVHPLIRKLVNALAELKYRLPLPKGML